jgi:hypothetical protein
MRHWLTLLLLVATSAFAQQPPAPPRDPAAPAQKGTGVIRGRVVAGDTGRPLRRARISLSGVGLGADARRSTSTGIDGSYTFKDLPAARYRITATRGGYLQLEFGQKRPNEQGRPIELGDGGTLQNVDFALPGMSGISGRITDENGEPIEGVSVYAMRSLFFEGRRRLVPVSGSSVRTDEGGGVPRPAAGAGLLSGDGHHEGDMDRGRRDNRDGLRIHAHLLSRDRHRVRSATCDRGAR